MRIGVDIGGTKIEAVALDADGAELARPRVSTPQGDYEATLDAVVELVRRLEGAHGPGSVGVGHPGSASPRTGLLRNANSVVLNGRPLGDDLSRRLDREVRLANDADCLALSEAHDGASAGAASSFMVIIGTGVGGGLIVDHQLVRGHNHIAGEWGHNPLPWPGDADLPLRACWCGRHGCLERYLSGGALAEDAGAADGTEVARLAGQGEPQAVAALDRYVGRLARGLATVVNLVDPDVIVLGGGVSGLDALYERVPGQLQEWVFADAIDTPVVRAHHGDSSGVFGAARLWPAPGT